MERLQQPHQEIDPNEAPFLIRHIDPERERLARQQEEKLMEIDIRFPFPGHLQKSEGISSVSSLFLMISSANEQKRLAVYTGEKKIEEIPSTFIFIRGTTSTGKTTARLHDFGPFLDSNQQLLDLIFGTFSLPLVITAWDEIEARLNLGNGENFLTNEQVKLIRDTITQDAGEFARVRFPFATLMFDLLTPASIRRHGKWEHIQTRPYNNDDPIPGADNYRVHLLGGPWTRFLACRRQAFQNLPTTATLDDYNEVNDIFDFPHFSSIEEAKKAREGASLSSIRTIDTIYNTIVVNAASVILDHVELPLYIDMILRPEWPLRLQEFRSPKNRKSLSQFFPELHADAFIEEYLTDVMQVAYIIGVAPSEVLQQGLFALAGAHIVEHNTGVHPIYPNEEKRFPRESRFLGVAFGYANPRIDYSPQQILHLRKFIEPWGKDLFFAKRGNIS